MNRACIDCGTITTRTRCDTCRRTHGRHIEADRPTRQQRGYGLAHQQLRDTWQQRINAGEHVTCWRCGTLIPPDAPWDLGHDDHDRAQWRGPEHVACNRATAGR